MKNSKGNTAAAAAFVLASICLSAASAGDRAYEVLALEGESGPRPREVLFFGRQENNHHNPLAMFNELFEDFERAQIRMTFTDTLSDLDPLVLAPYDAIFYTGNSASIVTDQAATTALIDFVEGGGGLVGVHVVSWSFKNSSSLTALLGGAFRGHHYFEEYTQIFSTTAVPQILSEANQYTTVDEPYLHQNLNPDITVLSWRTRTAAEVSDGRQPEPYTWVRTQGAGRVFYHAGGHDYLDGGPNHIPENRTWSQSGFRQTLDRGVDWVTELAGSDPFGDLGVPIVSASGMVVFEGDADGNAAPGPPALWAGESAGKLSRLAMDGDIARTQVGTGTWVMPTAGAPLVTDASETVFVAALDSGGGTSATLVGTQTGLPVALLTDGETFPALGAGVTVVVDPPTGALAASAGGVTLVRVALAGSGSTGDDSAVVKIESGVAEIFAREGSQVPDLPVGVFYGDLSDAEFTVAADGAAAMRASLLGAGVTAADDSALVHRTSGGVYSALREGDAVTGLAGVVVGELGTACVAGSDAVVVNTALSGAVTSADDAALLAWTPTSGEFDLCVRDGDAAVGAEPGATFLWDGSSTAWVCNATGAVVFAASLAGPAINDEGIWYASAIEGLIPLAVEGEPIPRGADVFAAGLSMSPICLDVNGAVAFVADVAGIQAGPALFGGAVGALQVVFRAGDSILLGGVPESIGGFSLASGTRSGGLAGQHLVVRVEFGVNQSAIVLLGDVTDLDGDGLSDLLEEAFGSSPGDGSDSLSALPEVALDTGGQISIVFNQLIGGGFTYSVEASADLINWFPSGATIQLSSDQDEVPAGYQRFVATPPGSPVRQFYRLRVTLK